MFSYVGEREREIISQMIYGATNRNEMIYGAANENEMMYRDYKR